MFNLHFVEVHVADHCNNNCRWCHNYSPFSPAKEYQASDYFEGLDVMLNGQINIPVISLMGGEPFLHSDLTLFAYQMVERYKKALIITTNGFWLSEETIKSYALLWKVISTIKISRYPTIEKRLGGFKEAKRIAMTIKKYNPRIHIEFPEKSVFNKLETFDQPVEVKRFCGNSNCTALLPDMTIHRCGAGAYKHFAPDGFLSDNFKNCQHMSYDLKKFDYNSFALWRSRYPLDACRYCNFSGKTPSVGWKVEKGHKPFTKEYEIAYYYNLGKNMIAQGSLADATAKTQFMLKQYGQQPEISVLEGLIASHAGDVKGSLSAFGNALKLDSGHTDARHYLDLVHKQIKRK